MPALETFQPKDEDTQQQTEKEEKVPPGQASMATLNIQNPKLVKSIDDVTGSVIFALGSPESPLDSVEAVSRSMNYEKEKMTSPRSLNKDQQKKRW